MQKPSKELIIIAYNELVKERGGDAIGERVFTREAGFSSYYWRGGYWRSWAAFQADPEWVKTRTEMAVNVQVDNVFMSATDYGPIK